MIKKTIAILSVFITVITANAQDRNLYQRKFFISGTDTLPYRILYPLNYSAAKKYPLVFFLHGSAQRGKDNDKQLAWGANLFLDSANRKKFPAIAIFPQCPTTSLWGAIGFAHFGDSLRYFFPASQTPIEPMQLLLGLCDEMAKNNSVDTNRVYVGGFSMGGFATFEVLWRKPHFFAAAFAICGAGNADQAHLYADKYPIWIFHGDADRVVPVANSRLMYKTLKAEGAEVKYTEYHGVGHDSYKKALAEPGLLPWLFAQRKS
ncbi:MAG: prolyl oligopeptidase family serine peptidase [Bacteroidetes bacterium]|nr:prolyl oligopeptidase family serine peptidase [Bacteroidota bacterium]MBS1974722.1 prolyl oligopeptidase family serine peptidase [Bacteroidota bacterium]